MLSTNVLPAIVHPTKCCVNHTCVNNMVPHVHPSHTTTVNHINYQHQHHFPHTQSVVNEVTSSDIGPVPGPYHLQHQVLEGPGPGFGPGGYPDQALDQAVFQDQDLDQEEDRDQDFSDNVIETRALV